MYVAGSAIAQNAGKICEWDYWRPWAGKTSWLLMGGAMEPPATVRVSDRRTRDALKSGQFLHGIALDFRNMQQALIKASLNLDNTISDFKMEKETAKYHLSTFFRECQEKERIPIVYYTGHGERETGNWVFHDGTLSIKEVNDLLRIYYYYGSSNLLLISDACFSGHWSNYCLKEGNGMHCLAAAPHFSTAKDIPDRGGELTIWITGGERPSTEPMYSGGNLADFPITAGFGLEKDAPGQMKSIQTGQNEENASDLEAITIKLVVQKDVAEKSWVRTIELIIAAIKTAKLLASELLCPPVTWKNRNRPLAVLFYNDTTTAVKISDWTFFHGKSIGDVDTKPFKNTDEGKGYKGTAFLCESDYTRIYGVSATFKVSVGELSTYVFVSNPLSGCSKSVFGDTPTSARACKNDGTPKEHQIGTLMVYLTKQFMEDGGNVEAFKVTFSNLDL